MICEWSSHINVDCYSSVESKFGFLKNIQIAAFSIIKWTRIGAVSFYFDTNMVAFCKKPTTVKAYKKLNILHSTYVHYRNSNLPLFNVLIQLAKVV